MEEQRQTHYLSDNVCHSLEEAPYDEMDESDNPYSDEKEYYEYQKQERLIL